MRITTQDRDDAAGVLQAAFSDGRLDEKEFDERMARVLMAKTVGDLDPLIADLGSDTSALSAYRPAPMHARMMGKSTFAIFSGIETKGAFILPEHVRINAVFGGCVLDLRDARINQPVSFIKVVAVFGGVQIIVPKHVRIEVHGTPFLGGISHNARKQQLPPDAPVIHVRGLAICGDVEILSKD